MQVSNKLVKGATVLTAAVTVIASGTGVAGAATHHRARLTFHANQHGYVHGPRTTAPGRVHLRSTGELPTLLFKRKHGDTAAKLVKDFSRVSPTKLFRDFTLVAELGDGYASLSRGTYYAISPAEHMSVGKIATMRVTGKRSDAALPASTTYRADSHRALHAPGSQSRHSYIHFVNNSGQLQSLILIGLGNDTSSSDVAAFLAHPTDTNLSKLDIVAFGEGGLVGAHHQFWSNAHLQSRRYIAALLPVSTHSGLGLLSPHLVTVR